MKHLVRIVSLALMLCTLFCAMLLPADAASSWPSLSSSSYCEFTAAKKINVYRNTSCSTRGTCSPASSYNAYIASGDVCRILEITSSYIKLSYPTSGGNKTGYIKRSDLLSVSAPSSKVSSKGKATTYVSAGGRSYGYVASDDKVYVCGESGNYTAVIYEAKSGSRAYKLGWVKTSDYKAYILGKGISSQNTSSWQYPMTKAYVCGNDWLTYYSARPSRPYHVGLDLASRSGDSNVYAAAEGTVVATGTNSANGKYVILEHTVSGKTVYSFYCHLSSYCVSTSSGRIAAGTKIGVYGNTGSASAGTHLHFAIANTLKSDGSYVGYGTTKSGNTSTYNGVTFYNPTYVINNNKLP